MSEAVVHLHPRGPLIALVGNPNCGKTALFNALTGSRQKVANYAGVTVERKEGLLQGVGLPKIRILDLPGTYSLYPRSPDERVTCDVLKGNAVGEKRPDLVVCVLDATNLRRNLRLVLAVKRLGLPCAIALNMVDLARQRGLRIDPDALAAELGVPVFATVAIRGRGLAALTEYLGEPRRWHRSHQVVDVATDVHGDHVTVRDLLKRLGIEHDGTHALSDRLDQIALHPVIGPLLLAVILFWVFQAVFNWAETPMAWIEAATAWVSALVSASLPDHWVRSLLVDGVIAGAGGVLAFLPQIVILFFFILVLEESGYLPRAAFLLDRIMGSVGLSGRSFIPLLSSFACAIPGIMAARTIANTRDRLVTIMLAPLMTCSARLPVYALLIGAFVPNRRLTGGLELQGLVLFGLYLAGILSAFVVAWVLKQLTSRGQIRPLMMELPNYHRPSLRNVAIGLWQRVEIFMRRVGGIILTLTVLMWFIASFPAPPAGAPGLAIEYSLAGRIGHLLAVLFAPIGFNWQISIALVPGLAAREVAVSALGTVYALSATGEDATQALSAIIAHAWPPATAYALLAWYVFAPQCLSTLATIRRETGGWTMPLVVAGYLFGLAYLAAWVTYRVALWLG